MRVLGMRQLTGESKEEATFVSVECAGTAFERKERRSGGPSGWNGRQRDSGTAGQRDSGTAGRDAVTR